MSRKNMSRKDRSSRKNMSRKNRSSRRNRCWSGGMAPVNDNSMAMGQRDSLAQGNQYLNMHKGQYGGSAPYPTAVTGSVLTGPMVAAARTGPLDTAMAQIQGMQDGGRRSHSGRRRKGRKGSKGRKSSRRSKSKKMRKMRGGELSGSALSQDSMLLPAGMDKQAALNYEWSLAKNPNAFAPRA